MDDHFPQSLTQRPNFIAPKEFINSNNEIISQENLRQLFSDGTQPKWAKDLILSELKPLFLRTRHLDNSKKKPNNLRLLISAFSLICRTTSRTISHSSCRFLQVLEQLEKCPLAKNNAKI